MSDYLTAQEVAQMICNARDRAGGVRRLAELWNLSPAYVSDLCHGRRSPGPQVAKKINIQVRHVRLTQYRVEGS